MGQKIDLTSQVQGVLPVANGGAGSLTGSQFADAEVPSGAINGANGTFLLLNVPNPAGSLMLFLNRLLQIQGTDYTLVGKSITIAPPASGSTIVSWYRYISSPLSLVLADSLLMSDSFSNDAPASQIPLGFAEQLVMADRMTVVFSPYSLYTEFMVMADSIRIVLLPLQQQPAETLTMLDAALINLGLRLSLGDLWQAWGEKFVYMSAGSGPDLYIPAEQLSLTDSSTVVLGFPKSFAEQMTQSDSFVVQLR